MKYTRVVMALSVTVGLASCSDVSQPNDAMPTLGLAKGAEKVTVCHNGQKITIAKPALPAHLAHGDGSAPVPGPVSWWPLDETSGSTATDIADGNDGTHANGPVPAPGFVAGALKFDGVDDRVDVPDSPSLRPQQFTIDAWVRSDTPSQFGCVVCKQFGNSFDDSYALWMQNGVLRAHVSTAAGIANIAGPAHPTGTFFHVAATWDSSVLRIYLNGTLVQASAPIGPTTIRYDNNEVILGADDNGVNRFLVHLNGLLDEVELFDRALSVAEIQAIADAGSAGRCKR